MRFLFLFLCVPLCAFTQVNIRIVDSASGRGLPYASVGTTDGAWGRVSDSAGVVAVPDSLMGKTLQASFVGYDARKITVRGAAAVALSPRVLPEVVVRACARDAVKRLGRPETSEQALCFCVRSDAARHPA
ncbi:hypothetical protein EPD60_06835 [Flaviaesturariibacter flavus]|uniref:Carboxypeptidase-like regulatory domain-containing protein n=1 Tax=Flaviaesturariibacter flavus TaxID=2502780 RepID=A0A4R1BIC2_9BACT|nr:hypothetical protein [Flaviaesturariibacter flavus]TCJ17019.1 hypothetical protein EPD60_06835 [Flaviaesturariibacter flavus]